MSTSDFVPAALSGILVVAALIGARLLPVGEATLLVRLGNDTQAAALVAAAGADASLVGIPAPGYAIVHGDAARVRATLGVAVLWNGGAPCSSAL